MDLPATFDPDRVKTILACRYAIVQLMHSC